MECECANVHGHHVISMHTNEPATKQVKFSKQGYDTWLYFCEYCLKNAIARYKPEVREIELALKGVK